MLVHEEMNKRETFISGGWMMCERLLRLSCGGAMDGRDWGWGSLREGGGKQTVCAKRGVLHPQKKKKERRNVMHLPPSAHTHIGTRNDHIVCVFFDTKS